MSETNDTALATRQPMAIGARGIQITTHDELYRFATAVCKSDFCPGHFRNDAGSTMVALEYSLELGIPMLQGLQNIYVINGKATIYGDLMLALVESSGVQEDFFEDFEGTAYDDDYKAICISKRRGRSRPTISQFSVQDAKVAKLWNKSGPWSTNPKRMLQMRARAFCLRDTYADVLRGLYSREEAEDAIDLLSGPQGYAVASEKSMLPPEIAKQLEPPPRQPTLVEIKELQELMLQAGVPKDRLSLEFRRQYDHLAEGRLTQKYLQENLTLDQYQELRDYYAQQLKQIVERDVKSHQPPDMWVDDAEAHDHEATSDSDDGVELPQDQKSVLLGYARRIEAAERTTGTVDEISKMFEHHKGTLPDQVFIQVEGYLLRRLKVAEAGQEAVERATEAKSHE